ncbi:RNA chaperone Hfq [Thermoactinomyces intermedius]|jgi:host factor-I protein|uniref:RNA chaperone Hfq n=1 Tax=Thermoactinomyces intermedius TaxID=2024 RepID=A0A8I1AFJ1_THEIN|nr:MULTISPECIES: RNA chaperone Hfq [Thermoactinomyces]MBA4548239.1 RNA chaperone Hfq [Thermoactinomyces intermedius]MBA4835197.1 RNA chaperone Hfq [Thermoactinomyces intermedius]MBH8595083.1 RNA chaperone Hfq [Thermoactinomyces intermedius]MBH8600260.1 RNA chaperone Hfq [Thermoactinomyces sp. CICC 23799]
MNREQDQILSQLKEKGDTVKIYLVNGYQYQGKVNDFDKYTISIEVEGEMFVISKKMVSTIEMPKPPEMV